MLIIEVIVGGGGVLGYIILNGVPNILSTPLNIHEGGKILGTPFNIIYYSTTPPNLFKSFGRDSRISDVCKGCKQIKHHYVPKHL